MRSSLSFPDMEAAFFAREAACDGLFVAAVRTTGLFCRPSCPARRPLREHVAYCRTVRDALFAGYRPCSRCRPMAPAVGDPEWAAVLRAEVEADPGRAWGAADLRARGLSPEAVRRWFQNAYGLTFTAWCRALRLGGTFTELRESAGHDLFGAFSALAPSSEAGPDPIRAALVETPLGPMVAAAVDAGLCLLEFADRRMLPAQFHVLARRLKRPMLPGDHAHLRLLRGELEAYFAGTLRTFTVPLFLPGTPFQEAVWAELRKLPHGTTVPYETLAARAGRPSAIRAAGHANGMNRVSILVPCHRVVNKDGGLCGYGGGLWRKRLLLELERTGELSEPSVPSGASCAGRP